MIYFLLLLLSAALAFSGYSAYKEDKRQGIALRQREVVHAFVPVIQNLGLLSKNFVSWDKQSGTYTSSVCPNCGSSYCLHMRKK